MTTNWGRALAKLPGDLGPAPAGAPLRMVVTCRTSETPGAEARRHPLVIDGDWTVEVPHDLASERLAVAFGGYLSCLGLADRAVPALREWMRRARRLTVPPMRFQGATDRWSILEEAVCCAGKTFKDAPAAARHWRSPTHVAHLMSASPQQVSSLTSACQRAHRGHGSLAMPTGDRERAAEACLGGEADVAWLWDAGIHPRLVWTIQRLVSLTYPLPGRFYLGVAWNRPDLRWVASTLTRTPEYREGPVADDTDPADLADPGVPPPADALVTWLAWTSQNWDVVDPTARFRWLGTGITRPMILVLGEAGYDPDEVVAHARAVNREPDAVARTIRQWLDAGFHPSPANLTALARSGVPAMTVPSRPAVDRLQHLVKGVESIWSITELALLLVQYGTVADAAAAIRAGAGLQDSTAKGDT